MDDRPALITDDGRVTSFGELEGRANRVARLLRARGLRAGDAIALRAHNRVEYAEVVLAALRTGLRLTPISWHLTAAEVAYIVEDCGAQLLVTDDAAVAGGAPALVIPYDDELATFDDSPLDDPAPGGLMLYTSGTTGRPKGVYRPQWQSPAPGTSGAMAGMASDPYRFAYDPATSVHLCTGPLYHSAPLTFSLIQPLNLGVTVVLMSRFDARRALALIEAHHVTHTHMVPTMLHRILGLPAAVRESYDVSSLRHLNHAAAPCPVPVKQAMIDWLGPIVYEYYSSTEGFGCIITPEEWLAKPGSVGRPAPGHLRVDDGGTVWIRAHATNPFSYFGDDDRTAAAYDEAREWFTVGDVGTLDDDGYLVLTDRTADLIISGGVNIYPAEIDAVLLGHPAVADAVTVGVPSEEWGEDVHAVVELHAGTHTDAAELIEWCRTRLAHLKAPKGITFVRALPRHDTGKIRRHEIREALRANSNRNSGG